MADEADVANALAERERDCAVLAAAERSRRARLAGAQLARAGGRRRCDDCDDPIAPARLAAVPFAIRCAECQTLRESLAHRVSPSHARAVRR